MIAGVTPGRYRLTASFPGSGRPGGWLLKSVMAGGQDSLDAPFTLQPNQHVLDATITFTDRLAQVTGTLRDAAGGRRRRTTPSSSSLPNSHSGCRSRGASRAFVPAADGAFTFRNLPAGDYLSRRSTMWSRGNGSIPAFLQRLAPAAVRSYRRGR